MSIHKTLFIGGALLKQRSVLTRRERLDNLEKEGRWNQGDSVFGLPKVRTRFKVVSRKQKKAQATPEETAGETPAEGEAPQAEPGS